MSARRRAFALVIGIAVVLAAGLAVLPGSGASAGVTPQAACTAPPWAEGTHYAAGDTVTYAGHTYQALVAHTPPPGAGWNPAATPALWKDLGACTGGGTTPPPTTAPPSTAPPTTAPPTTPPPSTSPPPGGSS